MTSIYDGTDRLGPAIAALYDFSPKSDQLIATHIAQAKAALGIDSKAKNMPVNVKLAIWQWHYDRVNALRTIPHQTDDYELKTKHQSSAEPTKLSNETSAEQAENEVNELRTIHYQVEADTNELSNETKPTSKGGRPRKHNSDADRMKAYRCAQRLDGRKAMLLHVNINSHCYITALSKYWNCSQSEAVDRIVTELVEPKYLSVLYSSGEDDV